jgi:serine/threonine protein kinase
MELSQNQDRVGETIGGRYLIRRLLGIGGFSTVYEAAHTITHREVAVKVLHPHLLTNPEVIDRFLLEARSMSRIRHEGIVEVLDAGVDEVSGIYIVLELLQGESLESKLIRVSKIPWREACFYCAQVLDALGTAHQHGVIHRDLKPGNIFIAQTTAGEPHARLLDFGIALVAQQNSKITNAGMILGTPEYMSPEQCQTASVGPQSDLWAMGVVLWECITGETPFAAPSTTGVLLRIVQSDARPIREVISTLPQPIAAIIDKSLARDPALRWQTAEEMREALVRVLHHSLTPGAMAAERLTATQSTRMVTGVAPKPAASDVAREILDSISVSPADVVASHEMSGERFSKRSAQTELPIASSGAATPMVSWDLDVRGSSKPPSASQSDGVLFPAAFQAPPAQRLMQRFWPGGAVLAALAVVGIVWWRGRVPPPAVQQTHPQVSALGTQHSDSEGLRFVSLLHVEAPSDNPNEANALGRHAIVNLSQNSDNHLMVSCVPGAGGTTLSIYDLSHGASRRTALGVVACNGNDLGVLPDVTSDGVEDIVAVSSTPDTLVVIDGSTARPRPTLSITGLRGIATGAHVNVRGEAVVIVYVEPVKPTQATEVRAVSARTLEPLWSHRGDGTYYRIGTVGELGLATGPDANGDGVGDVVMGMRTGDGSGDNQRCVQLLSGMDGRALWPAPSCRASRGGVQSLSLGPDVNGDERADVVVATSRPADGVGHVVVLSGADGSVLRNIQAPTGATNFGTLVSLGGDINGDQKPDMIVTGDTDTYILDGATGVLHATIPSQGNGRETVRAFMTSSLMSSVPWSIFLATSSDGLYVMGPAQLGA